jgi:hypothetical protein
MDRIGSFQLSIDFRYDASRQLVIHIGVGPVSIDDIDSLRSRRRSAGVPAAVPYTLTDMRRAYFDFDTTALKAHEKGLPEDEYAGHRQAEITTDPKTTAILMVWRNWLPRGVLVEIFSTPEAAYDWLGVAPQDGDLDP